MDKKQLQSFLIKARSKTYASGEGEVKPAFEGSKQLEYKTSKWLYRDIFFVGNGKFMGLETIYFEGKPGWSMSYYGNFQKMTEEEVDKVLRGALSAKKDTARLWHKVKWEKDEFKYYCYPDESGSINEMGGQEEITKDGEKVYFFFYAGGLIA